MQTISTSRKKAGKGKPVPADSKRMPHRPLFGRRLNILLYIGGTAQLYRDLFSGSLAFCRVHDVFNLRIVNSVPELRRLARERDIAFDGVAFIPVTMYGKFQTRSKIVSYNGCPKRRRPPAHVIDFTTDNAAVARMAAEHLLANPSVKKCVYVWDSTVPGNQIWMQERLAAFRIAVEAAGREFESLDITRFFSTKRNIVLETSRRFARFHVTWPELEPAKGQFRWETLDYFVDKCREAGLEPAVCFYGTPRWASAKTSGCPVATPACGETTPTLV